MADDFLNVQRTFPKKAASGNNSELKKRKWKKGRQKFNNSVFNESYSDSNDDEVSVSSMHQQSKNGKARKAKKEATSIAKNTGKQFEDSSEEYEFNNCSWEESVEIVSRTSDYDRSNRLSGYPDEEESNIKFSNIQKSGVEMMDKKSFATNSTANELGGNSSDEENVTSDEEKITLARSRKPIRSGMISLISQDEKTSLDNKGFREEIAKIPLGKAKQLRERLGKKLFDRAFFDEDSSPNDKKTAPRTFVRENPKRPREVSSKKPVSKFRNVFENEKLERTVCDPRFDSRCGEFNDYIYHNNYSFLDEIRQREKKILMKELKNASEDGPLDKNKLKEALRKMKNQEKTQADINRRKEVIREIRHENNKRMLQGLPPVFKTRAQIREIIWRKKYDDLKGGKKLEKYLRRKMKKQDKRRNGINASVSQENEPILLSSD